jgi:hypothetical protein
MCIQVVERYSVCRCLYYKHAVDPCAARAQRGHSVQEKTVLVGYACGKWFPCARTAAAQTNSVLQTSIRGTELHHRQRQDGKFIRTQGIRVADGNTIRSNEQPCRLPTALTKAAHSNLVDPISTEAATIIGQSRSKTSIPSDVDRPISLRAHTKPHYFIHSLLGIGVVARIPTGPGK